MGEISKKVQESRLKWCEETDGDGGAREKKKEDRSGGSWITSRMKCRRENCQGRQHKFNGGFS